jgi:hypothetical protein
VIAWLLVTYREARTVTCSEEVTGEVWIVKFTDVAPAGTVTVLGTWTTEGFSDTIETTAPPAGAGPLSVTVPIVELPPWTVRGLTTNE